MCLAAIYWARIPKVFYANTRRTPRRSASTTTSSTGRFPSRVEQRTVEMRPLLREAARAAFAHWTEKADKVRY